MLKISLRFLRSGQDETNDDVIHIYSTPSSELFRVTYRPADTGRQYSTHMTRGTTLGYTMDILKSMRYDVDPFDRIQVMTDLHPSVMYSVADMDDFSVRRNIENALYTSLHTHVVQNEL
jgi:hypothetical protein